MATVIHIRKGDTQQEISKKLQYVQLQSKKQFDAKQFTGKIKSNAFGNAVSFQRKLRDEWE